MDDWYEYRGKGKGKGDRDGDYGGKGKGGKAADGHDWVNFRLPHEQLRRKENIKRIIFEDKLRLTDYWAQCDRLLVNDARD